MDPFDKNNKIGVVGVSRDPWKPSQKIFIGLIRLGYRVFGISPAAKELAGKKIYNNLSEVPEKLDLVLFFVPPKITKTLLEEVKKLGIKYVWFQPGSYDEDTIKKAEELGLNYTMGSCFYVDGLGEKL